MMDEKSFRIKFWGVRGSYPVPGESTMHYGGNTPCVEVQAGRRTIILDAGTGIIGLGQRLVSDLKESGVPLNLTLFFSHLHHDHTQGLPFFAPAYVPNTRLNICVPSIYESPGDDVLVTLMASPKFPLPFQSLGAKIALHNISEYQEIRLGGSAGDLAVIDAGSGNPQDDEVIVRALRSYAHPQGVMIYRIDWRGKSLVYATDTEGYQGGDRRLIEFARGADVLIHDAQYSDDHYLGRLETAPVTQGFGHSTAAMACEIAEAAEVGSLVLFHHDPRYDDSEIALIETQANALFANTVAAREGREIVIRDSGPNAGHADTDCVIDFLKAVTSQRVEGAGVS
jgi:phosphoribosyl 1,2-cyclic phosphodiesterase